MESLNRPPLKLIFGTPEFLPEGVVQSTVRVGQKWRDDLNGKVAPRIPCVNLEGVPLGIATVVGSLFGSFKDFGYIGSTVNHQENCRDVDGLIDVLKECYPTFNPETDQISVIFFKYAPLVPVAVEEVVSDEEETDEGAEESTEELGSEKASESDVITEENLKAAASLDELDELEKSLKDDTGADAAEKEVSTDAETSESEDETPS